MLEAKLGFCLLGGIFAATLTLGQTPSGPRTPNFLVRMERFHNVEDVCVLVNDEGTYHLERVFRAKSEVYVGSLDTAAVDDLRARLNSEKLRTLSQQAVAAPLNSDTLDHFWIAINRENALQNLSFGNVESRNPYRESFDPLLNWLDALEKDKPGAVETGGAPTRCLPPKSIGLLVPETKELVHETSGSRFSETPIAPGLFLFRIVIEHFRGGDAGRSCAIVYSDGRYRVEKSVQSFQANMKAKVYENSLQPGSLEDLEQILDAPGLKSSEHRKSARARQAIPRRRHYIVDDTAPGRGSSPCIFQLL
jgi:hypothetical protein